MNRGIAAGAVGVSTDDNAAGHNLSFQVRRPSETVVRLHDEPPTTTRVLICRMARS